MTHATEIVDFGDATSTESAFFSQVDCLRIARNPTRIDGNAEITSYKRTFWTAVRDWALSSKWPNEVISLRHSHEGKRHRPLQQPVISSPIDSREPANRAVVKFDGASCYDFRLRPSFTVLLNLFANSRMRSSCLCCTDSLGINSPPIPSAAAPAKMKFRAVC